MAFSTLFPIDNSLNYIFNNEKINITGGLAELIPQVFGADVYIHCKLDNNQGLVAIDSSGNGRHGAFQGGLDETAWTTGKINSAIQGNGSGFINFNGYGDFERTDSFSIACWFKFTALVSTEFIISKQKNVSNFDGYSLTVSNGQVRFILRDDIGNVIRLDSPLTYNDGNWHFFVITWTHIDNGSGGSLPTGAKLYVDNVDVGAYTLSDTLTGTIKTPTIDLQISGRNGLNNQLLSTSVVDEVEIYDRELTPAEIDFIWNGGAGTQDIPGSTTSYPIDNPSIRSNGGIVATTITGLVVNVNIVGSDDIRLTFSVNGIRKWWDGAEWADSTGYSESNSIAEAAANITTLLTGELSSVSWDAFLHSDDGSTTPQLLDTTLSYDVESAGDLQYCTVYGTNIDGEGNINTNPFVIQLSQDAVQYFSNITRVTEITVIPNSITGYWEIALLETESMNENIYYNFIFTNNAGLLPKKTIYKKDIPNLAFANFWLLPDA